MLNIITILKTAFIGTISKIWLENLPRFMYNKNDLWG